jgi:hypothetical protein
MAKFRQYKEQEKNMKTIAILVSAAILSGMALAQEMPDMTPPKEMEKLQPMVGTWKGKEKHYEPGNTTPMEVESTMTYSMVLGGHFLKGEYKTEMPGMGAFSGMMMSSYDPAVKKYVLYWFDSMSNTGMRAESTMTGPKWDFVSEEFDMPGMGKTKMRTTIDIKSTTSYNMTVEMQMGDQWHKVLDGAYTKQ